ncbi:MAG: ATP-dependent helicase, partial [Bacteroidales bacterium]|nr:ATP-dependent helicase [Bacteroidales bacterium]
VHRIGRTGRAGANGTAISFCDEVEKEYLRDIEKLISKKIQVIDDHPYPLTDTIPVKVTPQHNHNHHRPRSAAPKYNRYNRRRS